MSVSSIVQTQINFIQPTSSASPTSGDGCFQVAGNTGTQPTSQSASASSTANPWQALSAELQSSLLDLQSQGTTSGTRTDATGNGQTVAQAHHHHHHHHGGGQVQQAQSGDQAQALQTALADPSATATAAATPISIQV